MTEGYTNSPWVDALLSIPEYREKTLRRFENSFIVDSNGCWIWKKNVNRKGYGMTSLKSRMTSAHRVSYRLYVGPIRADNEARRRQRLLSENGV